MSEGKRIAMIIRVAEHVISNERENDCGGGDSGAGADADGLDGIAGITGGSGGG
uniref:Bm7935 n=1 Tax=Brugia malayi TaxID=6279 RepID=A0A1I9G8A2_BRUMA|nr:Bm7935 [Brugia malayi]